VEILSVCSKAARQERDPLVIRNGTSAAGLRDNRRHLSTRYADYTYWQKYGIRDYRGGGRQSARETGSARRGRSDRKKVATRAYGVVIRAI